MHSDAPGGLNRPQDLFALTKPRITLMVLVSAGAGYVAGSGGEFSWSSLLVAMLGIGLVAGGTSALNQVVERDIDALMHRTRGRPLPTGRVTAPVATVFSTVVSLLGVLILALQVNVLTAVLAAVALLSYVLVYTPLKRVSSLSTLVGAVPGALPIMGGWTAATGSLDAGGWALFGILFFWQLPHFLALAWLYRDDYRRGGLKMLGVTDVGGRQSRHQSVLYTLALLPTSLLPALLGLTGPLYAVAALLLTGTYVGGAVRFAFRADSPTARSLFRISLLYLPLLLMLLTVDGKSVGAGSSPASERALTTQLR
jgi:protoheme IX farnesyltransferase